MNALPSRQRGFFAFPAGLGASKPAPTGGDPSFSSVKLLLHFDGADGSASFPDSSPVGRGVFSLGGSPVISTAQSVFGGASVRFDGSAYIQYVDSADWDFGTGDGTVECRVRFEDTGTDQRVLGQTNSGGGNSSIIFSRIQSTGNGSMAWFNGTGYVGVPLGSVAFDTWYAYRFVKSGNDGYAFLDGVLVGSAPIGGATNEIFNSSEPFCIGRDGAYASNTFKGYVDELRFTKGVARSTSSYVLDTAAFPNF